MAGRLLALGLGCVLAVGLLELGLRAVLGNLGVPYSGNPGDGRCVGLEPSTEMSYTGWIWRTPRVVHDVNSWGYRGPARAPERPPGAPPRVMVLGDSVAWGHGVNETDSLPSAMEDILRSSGRPDAEVLNFAVPGLNVEGELRQFEHFGADWKPDLVVWILVCGDLRPGLCGVADEQLRQLRWVRRLYLLRLPMLLHSLLREESPPDASRISQRRQALTESLDEMQRNVDDAGAELAVVTLGDPIAGRFRPLAEQAYLPSRGDDLQQVMEASGLPWLDASPLLLPGPDRLSRIPGEGHLDPAGNLQLAGFIVDWLTAEGRVGTAGR